ncbi:ATP-binding protein [Corynebacterium lowii]|uniref:Divergent AAA domain protein n=1 Tax=Corynebacterium lowii TaxID=1544413 RepID=A0A0Q0UE92_9CORY|nr:ATP-binding protein [Corynebacterium lowii]KQB86163.1 Divergent AAA domain protein [Corynebacterium lowii]MDP9852638.1 ATP-dependent DNA helicase RecG [Corynebacterium lowii]
MDSILHAHLRRLRSQKSDDDQVEVKALALPEGKRTSPEFKSVWETVSAFANTKGGLLFLGLSEDTGFTPTPGFRPGEVIEQIHQGLNASDPAGLKVQPVPPYEVTTEYLDGSPVVIMVVQPLSVNGPCYVTAKGVARGSYKRVWEADRHLSQLEIYELQHRFDQLTIDATPVPNSSIEDLDPELLESVKGHLRAIGSRALTGAENQWLRRLNITTDSGELTLAGLLALGTYPQQYFPKLLIDVAVHPGINKGETSNARFLDRRICDGNLLAMTQDCLHAIRKNLRVRRVISGTQGRDLLEIPEDVLREAVANAIMHREYAPDAQGRAIHVDIYQDRVEIISPGGFPGAKPSHAEALMDGIPAAKNRLLTRLLAEVPWPGEGGGVLAESNGSGIPRMFSAMREAGLPTPEYHVDIAQVRVVLKRFGLMDPETNEWLTGLLSEGYSTTDGIALVLARDLGAVNTKDIRIQTGQDSDDIREQLTALKEKGLLVEVSPDHFRLPEPSDHLSPAEREIVAALSQNTPMTSKEIAAATQRSLGSLRPLLRDLVDSGFVLATAPPTSRNRAYLLPRQ